MKSHREILENCNHEMVKVILPRKFSWGVIPKDLAVIVKSYMANPCLETAEAIVEYDSEFLAVFELCQLGSISEQLFSQGDLK